jgi:hypothetical protein
MDIEKLKEPFPPDCISWRIGSTSRDKSRGLALAYIDARDVMERLDEVCGPANWQDRYEFHGPRTICYLSVRIGDEWVTKADGAGDSDVEAEKGSISDALKRAAVKWGIGRYLYDLPAPWVEVETYEKSGKVFVKGIKDTERPKLDRIARGGKEPPKPQTRVTSGKPQETPFDDKDGKSYGTVADALCKALKGARTPEELEQWREDNRPTVNSLPPDYKRDVAAAFNGHMTTLELQRDQAA